MEAFFDRHPVFSLADLRQFQKTRGTTGYRAAESLLAYYVGTERVVRIRRGLYAVVPRGIDADRFLPDPYLVASRLASDAILVYHTALGFHGRAYSVQHRMTIQSRRLKHALRYKEWTFQPVSTPRSLVRQDQQDYGVGVLERSGVEVRVTSLERTMVDVLDRPNYSGSWEEIWRSLLSVEFYDFDRVITYVQLLNNSTTAAKVGLFLYLHKETYMVEDRYLHTLRQMRPKRAHYLDRLNQTGGRLVKEWNLIVPEKILDSAWEEVI